jgi:hypothetical protein
MRLSRATTTVGLAIVLYCAAPLRAAQDGGGVTNSKTEIQTNLAQPSQATEAAYAQTIEKRAADVLKALDLKEQGKAAQVHDILIAQYRALRDWHDQNGPKLKAAAADASREIKASLQALHNKFIASLSAVLTPEQIDIIKDKMTYNKVKVTFGSYCKNLPNLTEAQKQKMLNLLKQAREEAMDAGSSDEKNKIFRQFKGRINNYLSKEGYNAKQADQESNESSKAKSAP